MNRKQRFTQNRTLKTPALKGEIRQEVRAILAENIETKLCTYTAQGAILYTGTVASATANLIRGDAAVNECTGILIKPKRLRFRLVWSTVNSYNTVRFVVIRWHDSTTPVGSGILQSTGNSAAPLSSYNWVNNHKMSILYDRVGVLYDRGAGISADVWSADISLRGTIQLPLSGAGATPQMDGIYFLYISDDGVVPSPQVEIYSELLFTDA